MAGKRRSPPIEERIAMGGFPYTATPGVPVCPPKYSPDLDLLHLTITELIRRCFIDGHRDPHQRPGASAWERQLPKPKKHSFSALTSTFIQTTYRVPQMPRPACDLAAQPNRQRHPTRLVQCTG